MNNVHPQSLNATVWPAVELGDERFFAWESGLWTGKKSPFTTARVLRNTNFADDGRLDYSNVAQLEVESRYLPAKRLLPGDIILERSGGGPKQPVGRVAFFEIDDGCFSFSNFTSRLRIQDGGSFDARFVHFVLLHFHLSGGTLTLQHNTTGIRNLRFSDYLKTQIPMPPLLEQRGITSLLVHIQNLVDIEDRRIVALKELRAATTARVFREGLFGVQLRDTEIGALPKNWEVESLGGIVERMNYGTSVRCTLAAVGAPVLRIPNVIGERINETELKYATLPQRESEKLALAAGDILFVRTNGNRQYTGRSAVYEGSPLNALFASYLIRVRLRPNTLLPHFVRYFLSATGRAQITSKANPAADGKFNVDTGILKGLRLPKPPKAEQESIVELLSSLDERLGKSEQRLSVLQELFRSLLDQLISGQLSVAALLETRPNNHA